MEKAIIEIEKLILLFNENKKQLALDNKFEYLFFKSFYFIENTLKNQVNFSNVNKSSIENSIPEYKVLDVGCRQILSGKGLLPDEPFTNIGVLGFYTLFDYFNYRHIKRKTRHSITFDNIKGALDEITFENSYDGSQVTYYNFCTYSENN